MEEDGTLASSHGACLSCFVWGSPGKGVGFGKTALVR